MPTSKLPDANGLLIKFDPGSTTSEQQQVLRAIGARIEDRILPHDGAGDVVHATLGRGLTMEEALVRLSDLPGVSSVEPDYALTPQAVSNDAAVRGGSTWGLYGDSGSPANAFGSQAAEAWSAGFTGTTKVAVGVVDTGVDYTHPDLYLNIWLNQREIPTGLRSALKDIDQDGLITFRDLNNAANAASVADKNANSRIDAGDLLNDPRWENGLDEDANGYKDDLIGWDWRDDDNDPMDDAGHGTHVAGTIGAVGGNGVGLAGVAWSTQIVALRFMDANSGFTSDAIQALDYFTNAAKAGTGVDFVATNNSWGGSPFSPALLDAIVRGAKQDILFVGAAGNGGADGIGDNDDATPYYPSSYTTAAGAGFEAVIAVAALNQAGKLSAFSNYGATSVDIAAPGESIYSTLPGGAYGYMSGTSMATPYVTGAIALYSAYHPTASAAQIRAALLESAIATSGLSGKVASGARLDIGGLMGDSGATTQPPPQGGSTGAAIVGTAAADTVSTTLTVAGQRLATTFADTISGLAGNDSLSGDGGADNLMGGTGADSLAGGAGNDRLDGGDGADVMQGGAGDDIYFVNSTGDVVSETAAGGSDLVSSSVNFTLGANVETLWLGGVATTGVGNAGANSLQGTGLANRLDGLAGNDLLSGREGADTLDGGAGVDRLYGGAGADRFVLAKGEAGGDTIYDFAAGDVIQLTGYAAGSTVVPVAGSTTDWAITDGATLAREIVHLQNGYVLKPGDFLFA